MKLPNLTKDARKFGTASVGAIAQGVSIGVLHGAELKWATAIIVVATAAGVYAVPNAAHQGQSAPTVAPPVTPPPAV